MARVVAWADVLLDIPMDVHMDVHTDVHMDVHMDVRMDVHMHVHWDVQKYVCPGDNPSHPLGSTPLFGDPDISLLSDPTTRLAPVY